MSDENRSKYRVEYYITDLTGTKRRNDEVHTAEDKDEVRDIMSEWYSTCEIIDIKEIENREVVE